jgi:RimJ/RimL family protein N-acetyltransferase
MMRQASTVAFQTSAVMSTSNDMHLEDCAPSRGQIPRIALSGSRLSLRPLVLSDAEGLTEAILESVATVGRWTSWCHTRHSTSQSLARIGEFHSMWETRKGYEFAIFDTLGNLVGGVGIDQIDWRNSSCNMGYWIRQSRQGAGLASEAANVLANYAFRRLGLTRIEFVIATDNAASRRTAEKSGARFEGIVQGRLCIGDISYDAAIYSLSSAS